MIHATMDDFETIKGLFKKYRFIFPHIRNSKIISRIEAGEMVFQDGVMITYSIRKNKLKIGTFAPIKGDCVLHQILVSKQGNGNASRILNEFFKFVDTNVVLSVRADNDRAQKFYLKNNMALVGDVSWSKGTLPGKVYLYIKQPII